MKKRFLSVLFIFALLMSMSSLVLATEEESSNSNGFTVQAIHQEYKESIKEYPMVLTLTNNTDEDVTVTGDENKQLTIFVKSSPHPMAEKEPLKFDLYEGAESIVVEAGKTKEIVEVPAGPPGSWQTFYHPNLITGMDVVINIEGEEKVFPEISYGITGIISNPLYIGKIDAIDNEDGTATLKFKLTAYNDKNEVVCSGSDCAVIQTEPELVGLKTGLKKSDFSVQKDGQLLGEIIQAKEINDGDYEVVWKHVAGTFEGIMLNTASGYGDFYVSESLEEASEGNYSFNATITHTKDPVVIKHEDATFETAGATNIPKIVNLYFKEVSSEITEDRMKVIEENVQKTSASKEIVHIYDISLLLDGEEIKPNGAVKITIPLDDEMKKYVDLKVVYITDTGEVIEVESEITENGISFITDHFSYYAVVGTSKEVVSEAEKPELPEMNDTDLIKYGFILLFVGILSVMFTKKEENI
jgi:hypothetical protein